MEINASFGNDSSEPLKVMTCILRVSIHCEGCKKKVKKVLQSIEGVYKVEIDSHQHKVVITGNVDSETLIRKLVKSGKQAQLLPSCNYSDKEGNKSEKSNKKKKQGDSKAKKDDGSDAGDEEITKFVEELENPLKNEGNIGKESQKGKLEEEEEEEDAVKSGGGGGNIGKKKKKKGKKGNIVENYNGAPASSGSVPVTESLNLSPPNEQMSYHPQFYYGVPEYGMSYNTAESTANSATSYYAMPVQYNMYSHPYNVGPSPPSDREVVDINIHGDYYREDESGCSIM